MKQATTTSAEKFKAAYDRNHERAEDSLARELQAKLEQLGLMPLAAGYKVEGFIAEVALTMTGERNSE